MAMTVTMPQLGETVTEGTILSWAKQPGDTINEDDVLLEISTDKVDTEVPSPASGTLLEILVAEGETVAVGTPLAVIGDPTEVGDSTPSPTTDEAPSDAPDTVQHAEPANAAAVMEPIAETPVPVEAASVAAPVIAGGPMRGVLSPVVRRLAAQYSVDLDQVAGTGDGGRITRKDVMTFVESGGVKVTDEPEAKVSFEPVPEPPPAPAPVAATPAASAAVTARPPEAAPAAPGAGAPPAAAAASAPEAVPVVPAAIPAPSSPPATLAADVPSGPGDTVIEIPRLRRRIAENLIEAKQTAAHVWASVEVDYENVEQVRARHKDEFKTQEGFSLTYLPFISRATIDALQEYPAVNSSFYLDKGVQVMHSQVNLGIAVDLNQSGLIVVTVRGADGLRLKGLAREIRAKATAAHDGHLNPDDISGSSFTITNPGPYGSFMTAPIINRPNSGILSTDTITKRATVVTDTMGVDSIAIHHIGYLGLTWDHRVFDGSTAVLFLKRIKDNLETWDWEQELA